MSDDPVLFEVAGRSIEVSSPHKQVLHDVTKRELATYYERIADRLLVHAADRPVSAKRMPDGTDGPEWFAKQAPKGLPEWVRTAPVPRRRDGGVVDHVVLDDAAHLVQLAQLAAVELHVGLARVDDLDHPDELLFDLDPPPDAPTAAVREATRRVLSLCDELGVPARLKTSGSKGFHVHVPLDGTPTVERAKGFAGDCARLLAARHPDELTVEHRIDARAGRVFVDWLRNGPAQTAVAAYSPRARPGAPVAAPLDRDELAGADPRAYGVRNLFRRLGQRDDPWGDAPPRTDLVDARGVLDDLLDEVGAP